MSFLDDGVSCFGCFNSIEVQKDGSGKKKNGETQEKYRESNLITIENKCLCG
jgi:hypothetical protein